MRSPPLWPIYGILTPCSVCLGKTPILTDPAAGGSATRHHLQMTTTLQLAVYPTRVDAASRALVQVGANVLALVKVIATIVALVQVDANVTALVEVVVTIVALVQVDANVIAVVETNYEK